MEYVEKQNARLAMEKDQLLKDFESANQGKVRAELVEALDSQNERLKERLEELTQTNKTLESRLTETTIKLRSYQMEEKEGMENVAKQAAQKQKIIDDYEEKMKTLEQDL